MSFLSVANEFVKPCEVQNRVFAGAKSAKRLKRGGRGEEVGGNLTPRRYIADGYGGGEPLRVGDHPLPKLHLRRGIEIELDLTGRLAALVLERDGERTVIALDADDA